MVQRKIERQNQIVLRLVSQSTVGFLENVTQKNSLEFFLVYNGF